MSHEEQVKHEREMELENIAQRLEAMQLSQANPVTVLNLQTHEKQNPSKQDLDKLVDGFAAIKAYADSKHITIAFNPFVVNGKTLITTFTLTHTLAVSPMTKSTSTIYLSKKFVDQSTKDLVIGQAEKFTKATDALIDHGKTTTPQEKLDMKAKVDQAKKDLEAKLKKTDLTEKELEKAVTDTHDKIEKIQKEAIAAIHKDKLDDLRKKHPELSPEELLKLANALDKLGTSASNIDEANKLMNAVNGINVNSILNAGKIMSKTQKIMLIALSGITAIGAGLTSLNVFKLLTMNKRLAKIPNQKIKMKSARKMAIISGIASVGFVGITVGLMILVFVVKGGL